MVQKNISKLKSSELKGAILGMLLGDASISRKSKRSKHVRLSIGHSIKQSDYLRWKEKILFQIPSVKLMESSWIQKLNNGKVYTCIRVETSGHLYIQKIYDHFYINNRKNITRDWLDRITPLGLLLWYLDDGYLSIQYKNKNGKRKVHDRKLKLATHGFTIEEQECIREWLDNKYDIQSILYKPEPKKKPEQRAIYLNASNAKKFLAIISPYKPNGVFNAKFDMKYNGTTCLSEDMKI